MEYVVLDTDVASMIQKKRLPTELTVPIIGKIACITFVTVAELHKWAELRRWGRRRRAALEQWLTRVLILPYDPDVARTWGRLSANAQRRGRPRPANDMWIAACCLVQDMPLITLNRKDFIDFTEHEGLDLLPT